jgi:single-strand DNA-binding protein
MIRASIFGRAGSDGELRQSPSGKPWCRVSVACEAGGDRQSGEAYTQWLTVVAFGSQAEILAKARKGQPVCAMGRVEISSWQGQNGEQKESLQLLADTVLTAASARPSSHRRNGKGKGERPANSQQQGAPAGADFDDDIQF